MITNTSHSPLQARSRSRTAARTWQRRHLTSPPLTPTLALTDLWFGPKSLPRITVLLQNFRHRYDAYPLVRSTALHRRSAHRPASLAAAAPLVCHWHTQLTDPLYRAFTRYLEELRSPEPDHHPRRNLIWLERLPRRLQPGTMSTRVQFASKLLSAAYAAGLGHLQQ